MNTRSALNSLPSTLGAFLRRLQVETGHVFTVIAGGPDLCRPGQLSIMECVVPDLSSKMSLTIRQCKDIMKAWLRAITL